MLKDYFGHGINVGGWLSQYDCLAVPPQNDEELTRHLETYITEDNIRQIASWKMDHIRLPLDYKIIEDQCGGHDILNRAFVYLDRCAGWCEKYGLNLLIDLHNAQGNIYGAMDKPMPLLTDVKLAQRFTDIWKAIAEHFKGKNEPIIMFELLNEVSDGSGYLWNTLAAKTVEAIRQIDSDRFILVGSNEQNSAFRLKELKLFDDEKVFYNFHFYDPQVFTHQNAHFSEEMKLYGRSVNYPDDISSFTDFLLKHRKYIEKYSRVALEERVDRPGMERLLKDAIDFVKYSGKELYCGEFGVINTAPDSAAVGWLKDVTDIFDKNNIGHAMWNYKLLDFGFIDGDNQIVSKERTSSLFGV